MTTGDRRTEGPPPSPAAPRSTPSGIPLEPVYVTDRPPDRPGQFPFTRGIHPDMYRGRLWTFRQYSGFGSAEETNRRFQYLLGQGQTGLSVAFDLPTQIGYDSDHSLALGEVGKVGVPISTLDDMAVLLDGIPLEEVSISMTINSTAPILLAFLVALARWRGVPVANLRGTLQNDMLKEFIARRTYRLPVRPSLRLAMEAARYSVENLPRFNPISVSGYHMREAGSTAVQEIALTFANAITYLKLARQHRVDPQHLARRMSFFWSAHNHLFEEVAKLRAARRLWAQIIREDFGIDDSDAARMRFHVQTAGSTLTFQEPENNAVRITIQALAAVLGGTQSLHTNAIDEALGLPSELSARTALRTQQILAYESGVADVADPLGGSPFVEKLTDRVEAEAREILEEISRLGGAVAALERGFQQGIIEEEAYRTQRQIESGETTLVGVNRFRSAEERASSVEVPAVDPALESTRIGQLKERKARRDSERITKLRRQVENAARGEENIMESLIAGAEGGVTLGEMMETLAEVFGEA